MKKGKEVNKNSYKILEIIYKVICIIYLIIYSIIGFSSLRIMVTNIEEIGDVIILIVFTIIYLGIFYYIPYLLYRSYIKDKRKDKIIFSIAYLLFWILIVVIFYVLSLNEISNNCDWCNISEYRGE